MSLLKTKLRLAAPAILWLACATVMTAQVRTQTTEHPSQAKNEVKVERGEVVYVAGNELVVKMEDGQVRHFTVPDGAKAMVDGKELTLQDLRPGMKLERTITTTTTEKTVKTVKTGTGTVIQVMPPNSVTVQFEDNTVQRYTIPKGTKFTIDGEQKTAFDLKKGMKITATRITEVPTTEIATSRQVTGAAPPPPPPTPTLRGVLLIAEATPPEPAPVAMPKAISEPTAPAAPAEPAPRTLPATGSVVPLIGLLGALFFGAGYAVRLLRRS